MIQAGALSLVMMYVDVIHVIHMLLLLLLSLCGTLTLGHSNNCQQGMQALKSRDMTRTIPGM